MTILNTVKINKQSFVRIQCNNCGNIFERGKTSSCKPKFDYRMLKARYHYCSSKCTYVHRTKMESGYKVRKRFLNQACKVCNKRFKKWKSNVSKTGNVFCSKKCYGLAISNNIIPINIIMTDEVKEKIGEKARKRIKENGHCWTGKNHSSLSKEKMSIKAKDRLKDPTKNPMFGKNHGKKAREAISKAQSQMILDGKKTYGRNNHISGHYFSSKTKKQLFYRSSWELACMKWLDSSEQIKTYSYEAIRISYKIIEYNRAYKRYYIPDFLIEFVDGRKELWEIKPKTFIDNEKTRLKSEAARDFCKNNLIDSYYILTKEDLIDKQILTATSQK